MGGGGDAAGRPRGGAAVEQPGGVGGADQRGCRARAAAVGGGGGGHELPGGGRQQPQRGDERDDRGRIGGGAAEPGMACGRAWGDDAGGGSGVRSVGGGDHAVAGPDQRVLVVAEREFHGDVGSGADGGGPVDGRRGVFRCGGAGGRLLHAGADAAERAGLVVGDGGHGAGLLGELGNGDEHIGIPVGCGDGRGVRGVCAGIPGAGCRDEPDRGGDGAAARGDVSHSVAIEPRRGGGHEFGGDAGDDADGRGDRDRAGGVERQLRVRDGSGGAGVCADEPRRDGVCVQQHR